MSQARHGVCYGEELMTRDVYAAVKFYRDVMGWHVEIGDMGDDVPAHWMSYIAVDDIVVPLMKAKAEGT